MASKVDSKKLAPVVGDDGRLYFNYGVGAKYSMQDNGNEYVFEITDCRYSDNNVEYYKCAHNGEPYWNEFTAHRIHYLLHFNLLETVSEGERRELPLTVDEVKAYAQGKETARSAAVKTLGSTDYFAKDKELKAIEIEKVFAEVHAQSEKLAELTEKEKKLKAKQASILNTKKIDASILKETPFCSKCGETGVTSDNKVCTCAKKIQKDIKEYNAILRRRMQKKTVNE